MWYIYLYKLDEFIFYLKPIFSFWYWLQRGRIGYWLTDPKDYKSVDRIKRKIKYKEILQFHGSMDIT